MWTCPKCGTQVDPDFEVCWSCGTTSDGVEDPSFVTADEAGPIDEPEPKLEEEGATDAELPEPPLDLVDGYQPYDSVEAKFLVDQLIERGIPAVLGQTHTRDLGYAPALFNTRVLVRAEDLPRARFFFEDFEQRKKDRLRPEYE